MTLIQFIADIAQYHYEVTGIFGAILAGVFMVLAVIWMIIMWFAVALALVIGFGWPFILAGLVIYVIVWMVKRE